MARILIVDDEPAITGVLNVLVTGMGREGVACLNVAQVIDVLEHAAPVELILSNLRMNPESGFDLLKTLIDRIIEIAGMPSQDTLNKSLQASLYQ